MDFAEHLAGRRARYVGGLYLELVGTDQDECIHRLTLHISSLAGRLNLYFVSAGREPSPFWLTLRTRLGIGRVKSPKLELGNPIPSIPDRPVTSSVVFVAEKEEQCGHWSTEVTVGWVWIWPRCQNPSHRGRSWSWMFPL